jgi:peptidyl-tRNA hydrolase, PTH1 family
MKKKAKNVSERWLIVGLGNPGKQYERTRHNIGFMVIDALSRQYHIMGKGETRFNAIVGTGMIAGHPVVLVQPTTFMNLSGEAVSKLLHFYKIPLERCIVIYDEAALPFGKLRLRADGSSAGHNGIKSIIQCLGGNDKFLRIRLGVGRPGDEPGNQKPMHHHVLSRFSDEEDKYLARIIEAASEAVNEILQVGLQASMGKFNGMDLLQG